jgi:predicted small lipoprotein YifL
MESWKKILLAACLLMTLVSVIGCSEEGPMEKAGKQLDQAAEDAGKAAKKIFE